MKGCVVWAGLLSLSALVACGDDVDDGVGGGATSGGASVGSGGATTASSSSAGDGATTGGGGTTTTFGGDRPVELSVPPSYDGTPAPLVLSLHGYSGTGQVHEGYFELRPAAMERGMFFAHPEGTTDGFNLQFWNANAACCDFAGSGVDDSGYLRELVEEIQDAYTIDPKRIYFVGHSNGHFMSYRMACDHADLVAGVAGLAGGILPNGMGCAPSEPVHHLHIHGTADSVVPYGGGTLLNGTVPIAGAEDAVAYWAGVAGCDGVPSMVTALDLVTDVAGAETEVLRHDNCNPGGSAELWRVVGGSHGPSFGADFAGRLLDHLLAHPKP